MPNINYTHLKSQDFVWAANQLGTSSVTFYNVPEIVVTLVKGQKGEQVPDHTHSVGSLLFVLEGQLLIDDKTINVGDAGFCHNGGHYRVDFLEDSTYIVCRSRNDEVSKL